MNRRKFIQRSSAAAMAFSIVPRAVLGGAGYVAPSDYLNLGFIGVGKQARGPLLKGMSHCSEILIRAACDVDSKKLEHFTALARTANSQKVDIQIKRYSDYRELLAQPDIDAVVVATPDHWHAQMVVDAAKAGKDIYCEKPLSLTITEGRAMVNAVGKYKRVLQTGSMQRSQYNFRQAAELVYNGYIGDIKEINVSVGEPVRALDLPVEPIPGYLDWDQWIGPALYRGYHPVLSPPLEDDKWAWWRGYRDFGGGLITDWGAHMFDIVQWALGMDRSGPVEFTPPQTAGAKHGLFFKYANGITVRHTPWGKNNAIQFIGTEGQIEVSRQFLNTTPRKLTDLKFRKRDQRLYFSDNHYQDWINAIKKRSLPICDVETGHRSATVCNAVNIAYELQHTLKWDPVTESFDNDFANMMRSRPYRKGWDFNDF
ncbi:Gfo/Idh/MocA family protein [Sinomicrobium soli]|uniref:Gfo/Idh/MocA family protein n=1 Tax=Sinomicrobium sp. N-1-3-6 TaxID=2219864 RepID=UPI000DCD5902|nr:Gfo/Idh/MocA family oxidoreductase [Sinomicrobium sp. N-1-3-6]RAV28105.1 gfo/Idh/MocA family oxidoreductase [Sinomicrobium sp. N-1-3-6]